MAYRDLQYPPGGKVDWVMGKGFDASMAVGPWIVPKEEVGDPYPLKMELKVGDSVWQTGDTNDYVFRIPAILEHLTRGITVEPGDVISLGTLGGAAGFAFGSAERRLKSGDRIIAQIERIGDLEDPGADGSGDPVGGSDARRVSVASPRRIRKQAAARPVSRVSPSAPSSRPSPNG